MNAAKLMNPRFEVIADYPSSSNKVGTILECPDFGESSVRQWIEYFSRYPVIFKELKWWEHRTKEEMPQKLICKAIPNDTEVLYIEEWDMSRLWGWTDKNKREGCGLRSFNYEYGYFPVD